MRLYLPWLSGFVVILTSSIMTGKLIVVPAIQVRDSCRCNYYVFTIKMLKRSTAEEVQNKDNWEFYCRYGDKSKVSCAPGNEEACQLIVDTRDTDSTKEGIKLKPAVRIIASTHSSVFAKERPRYFVDSYIPTGPYFYYIINSQ